MLSGVAVGEVEKGGVGGIGLMGGDGALRWIFTISFPRVVEGR